MIKSPKAGTMFSDVEFLSTFADPVSVLSVANPVALIANLPVIGGLKNYFASKDMASAQDKLRDDQQKQLRDQDAAATALANKEAVSGQTFGRQDALASTFGTGLGYGARRSASGRGQLTGGV